MNRRRFLRGALQAIGCAVAMNYSRMGAVIEPEVEAEPSFGYFEEAPEYIQWERRSGVGIALPCSAVKIQEDFAENVEQFREMTDGQRQTMRLRPEFAEAYRRIHG